MMRLRMISVGCLGLAGLLCSDAEPVQDQADTASVAVAPVPADTLPSPIDIEYIPAGFAQRPLNPVDNSIDAEKVRLGRKLFFDPILSADNQVACATCHRPELAFADNQKIARGIQGRVGKRNAPTIINRGYGKIFSWDGRAATLEEQVLMPITNPAELGSDLAELLAELRADDSYVRDFHRVFGGDEQTPERAITDSNLAKAIAAFERSLVFGDSEVDRFRSAEYEALSQAARQGMWIFESRGGCWKCHSGENFSDEEFHNTGVGFGESDRDTGRFEQTKDPRDRFHFKTPTLRGIELTAPYMHDGSVATLREVVEFYNRGGAPDDPDLDPDMKPLKLSETDINNLVEFLKALSR